MAKLKIDDPRAKSMFSYLFLLNPDGPPSDWQIRPRDDLIPRGSAAVPLLLELFEENPHSEFRADFLFSLRFYEPIPKEPFVHAVRNLYQNNGEEIPLRTRYAIGYFVEQYGGVEDLAILKEWTKNSDPAVPMAINASIRRMEMRLADRNRGDVEELERSASADEPQAESEREVTTDESRESGSRTWIYSAVAMIGITAILWLLSRRYSR